MTRYIVRYLNRKGNVISLDVTADSFDAAEQEARVRRGNDIVQFLSIWRMKDGNNI